MKKLYTLIIALILSGLTQTYAQLGNGWDSAFNFGGAGNTVTEMRYDAGGNLYFLARVMGKNLFAGTQIDPGGFGSYPSNEIVYGKIAPNGTQTLLKSIKYGGEGRLDADGNLYMILRAGYPTAPTDFGNGIINNTIGAKILKISNTGVAQWMKPIVTGSKENYGAAGVAILNVEGMQFTPDGNLYVVTAANGVALNPPTPQFTNPHRIIKFNANGDEVWHTELFSNSGLAGLTVPKIFVDDAGQVTFGIYATSNLWYYNGEALASKMGVYSFGQSAYSIVISLNADGSKKNTIADLGTNATTTFEGLNPINGNLYIGYAVYAAKASTQFPFSTLPNIYAGNAMFENFLYVTNTTPIYNNAGQFVKYIVNKDVPALSTMVRYGNKFVTSLNLSPNVIYEKGDYLFNSTTDYSFIEFLDQDFNFVKALKSPPVNLLAAYQDKLSISGEFKTPLIFGSKTLIPNFNDPDFGTRYPVFASLKADMFIAAADAAVIAPPVAATWLGVDNNWNNTANWSNGQIPDATTIVKFNANSAKQPTTATTPTALKVIIDAGITALLPTDLTIKNKLIINGTLQINHTGVLNFTNYGASAMEGTGTIAFNGTNTPSVTAYGLVGNKDLSLSVNSNIALGGGVFKNITFTGINTIITSTTGIEVTNPSTNAIFGYSATNYIAGKITRAVNASGTYVFPNLQYVFQNLEPEPTTLTLNNLVGTSKITVANDNGPTAPNINFASGNCTTTLGDYYWRITPDVEPTSGTYDVSFQKSVFTNGVTDADRYVVLKRADRNTDWAFEGTKSISTQTGGTTSGNTVSNANVTAGLTGLTSFSDFVIGINSTPVANNLAVTTSTWTGSANTTWANIANWSNGIPNGTVNAIIPAGLTNYPLVFNAVNSNGDNAKSLTVNAGVNIKLEANLLLNNGLINNGILEITTIKAPNSFPDYVVYTGGISGTGKVIFKNQRSIKGGIINNDVEINVGKSLFNDAYMPIDIIGKIGGNINIISGSITASGYGGQFLESTNPDATITIANPDFHIAGAVLKSVKANGSYFLPIGDNYSTRNYGAITIKNNNLDAPTVFGVYFSSNQIKGVKIVDGTTPITGFLNSGQWSITPTLVSKSGTIDLIFETKNYTNGRTNVNEYVLLRRDDAVAKWIPVTGASITEIAGKVTVIANGLAPFTASTMFCIGLKAKTTLWTGATSTDWDTASNWDNGVPELDTKAQIIAGAPQYPEVTWRNSAALLEIGTGVTMKLPTTFDANLGLVNNGTIEVIGSGQFIGFNSNQSPLSGTGKLLFSNESPADITGAYMTGQKINNGLEINKTGGATTSYNMVVSGDLNLINGLVTTSGSLIMSNPDATLTATKSSYIVGTLNRKVNTNRVYNFPVGSATAYAPVNLTLNNIVGTQYINSSYSSTANITPPSISSNETVINNTVDNGTWTISPDVALTGGTYDVNLETNNYTNGVADAELYKIIKRTGPYSFYPWQFLGNTPTATQTGGILTDGVVANGLINASIKGLTSFSEFAIGIANPTVMPVTLTSFTAKKVSTGVKLAWQTASEKNSSHFEVEKSTDGLVFSTLSKVEAAGNSSNSKYYSITDFIPANGANYYRLKQVDLDGKTDLSQPISINFDLNTDAGVSVYPNPASDEIHFAGLKSSGTVEFFNLEGKNILSLKIINNTLQIPTEVKSGLYILNVKASDGTTSTLKLSISK